MAEIAPQTTADLTPAQQQNLQEQAAERKGSLEPTPNPTEFAQATTEQVDKKDIPPTSSVSSQNAPGKTGEIGENVMAAFGYGGAQVERPKEEQGLGEKIVNFLGA